MFIKKRNRKYDNLFKALLIKVSAADTELPELDEITLQKIKSKVHSLKNSREVNPIGWAVSKLFPVVLALTFVLAIWMGIATISVNKLKQKETIQIMQGDEMIDELVANSVLIGEVNLPDENRGTQK